MAVKFLQPRAVNRSRKVDLLIKLWDRPLTPSQQEQLAELARVKQSKSEHGNINNGTPFPLFSCLLGRYHPDFEAVLEPGVKDLVLIVANHHNLITYTSCEGHIYPNAEHPNDQRHVGIVARDQEERKKVLELFVEAGNHVNARFPAAAVEVGVMDHVLNAKDKVYPAVDLYLSRKEDSTWDDYFSELDEICGRLVEALRSPPPLVPPPEPIGASVSGQS